MARASALTPYEIPNFQITLPAVTNLARYRFISIDANQNAVYPTGTAAVLGVSRNTVTYTEYPDTDEMACDIATGIMIVESGGAITAGSPVTYGANGVAIAVTDADTERQVAVAMTTAAASGDLLSVNMDFK